MINIPMVGGNPDDLDLDMCCQDHPPEWPLAVALVFSRMIFKIFKNINNNIKIIINIKNAY